MLLEESKDTALGTACFLRLAEFPGLAYRENPLALGALRAGGCPIARRFTRSVTRSACLVFWVGIVFLLVLRLFAAESSIYSRLGELDLLCGLLPVVLRPGGINLH